MRYLIEDGATAASGLATDEALMATYGREQPERDPILRLYTYASHCALIGRYQYLDAEIDLDACERTGTRVNRRPTGGGAIVMGRGQLGVAVIDRARSAERPKQIMERLADGIVRGLGELGIHATFRGKNDLEVGGRKIAGLGLYLDGRGGMLFHSSILAGLDVGFMLDVLRIPAAKLGDKAVDAVSQRVTTVSRETGVTWDGPGLRDVIAAGFEKSFGVSLRPDEPDHAERTAAAELERTKYLDETWIRQPHPDADGQGSAAFKSAAGLVRVYVATTGAVVKSAMFCGDFNEVPAELVRLESALRWTNVQRAPALVGAAARALSVEEAVLSDAIAEAAARAAERTAAHPAREGSCYFPEVS